MTGVFEINEKLYRAVYPPEIAPMFWKANGQLSSAVFKDKRGLSVERSGGRQEVRILEYMRKFFDGLIISVNVRDCMSCNAYVKYLPTNRSAYHSEIHGSLNRVLLSPSQCKYLARVAVVLE